MIRVGLIGPAERPEIERLAIRLEERGAEPVVLDSRRDPEVAIGAGGAAACGEDLSSVRAFYVADLGIPSPFVAGTEGTLDLAASLRALDRSRRRLAAWETFFERVSRKAVVVNPARTHVIHGVKPFEIAAYAAAGLPVPETVSTTDPAALARLGGSAALSWITKGMVGGFTHTEPLEPPGSAEEAGHMLAGAPGGAAGGSPGGAPAGAPGASAGVAPLMAQERIEGDNVRAFVLDGECLGAAEAASMSGAETDSRRGATRVNRISLPAEAAAHAVAAARRWGMIFAAVDFMREARTGQYVLLEANSAPFFVNFEARTGIDISGRLAFFLTRKRP